MKHGVILGLVVVTLFISACTSPPSNPQPPACTEEAKICPDGSSVGRTGPNCEFAACPSTETSTFKEYKSTDPELCKAMRFTCGDQGEYFGDDSGCGCVLPHNNAAVTLCAADYDPVCGWSDPAKIQCISYPCAQTYGNLCMASVDPNVAHTTPGECPKANSADGREYVERDSNKCAATDWLCAEGMQQFYDSTGCGCEPKTGGISNTMPVKREAFDCTEPRPEVCTREYMPVCGQKDDSASSTYGNKCEACADKSVLSYLEGACASDFANYLYQPMQCEDTPWNEWYKSGGVQFVKAPTDAELITAYYGSKDIEVTTVEKIDSEMIVCQACGTCPTTYSFSMVVNTLNGVDILEKEGWTLAPQKY